MKRIGHYAGTFRYLYAHWPIYGGLYAVLVLSLVLINASINRGWWGLIPLLLAGGIILSATISASLWAAHWIHDEDGHTPHHVLFDLAQLQDTDQFVYVGLGLRHRAIALSRRLTTGKITVIDIYNPQWTTGHALARQRRRAAPALPDPRLAWRTGEVNLLPLPDESVAAVMLCQVAGEFWQRGDQLALLREIRRVLTRKGRLLLAERVRSRTNWLVLGPAATTLETAEYWRQLLQEAGYQVTQQRQLGDLVYCWRADKPTPSQARQLALDLMLDEQNAP